MHNSNHACYFNNSEFKIICLFNSLIAVRCPSLADPDNGMMNCSLGDDKMPFYEDTCNFTCKTGYELIGSDTRTCRSNGSWSGGDTVCRTGIYTFIYLCMYVLYI